MFRENFNNLIKVNSCNYEDYLANFNEEKYLQVHPHVKFKNQTFQLLSDPIKSNLIIMKSSFKL